MPIAGEDNVCSCYDSYSARVVLLFYSFYTIFCARVTRFHVSFRANPHDALCTFYLYSGNMGAGKQLTGVRKWRGATSQRQNSVGIWILMSGCAWCRTQGVSSSSVYFKIVRVAL
jgi:hypothetical protein